MSLSKIALRVNGLWHHLEVEDSERLLDTLRNCLRLVGVKEGCGTGECGACSVILNGELVNSCLIFAAQLDGSEVLTIEGLGKLNSLHPIQEAFLEAGAVQCGFCTPGMVLASKWLLDHNSNPQEDEIREALSGNLCRCTGYQKIFRAVQLAATKLRDP
jgi:aerobic-type carbon monoxide dehydrogenase small subunit (CoxS/CutS family)